MNLPEYKEPTPEEFEKINVLLNSVQNIKAILEKVQVVKENYKNPENYKIVEDVFDDLLTSGQYNIGEQILFMREMTLECVSLSYKEFPWFGDVVNYLTPAVQKWRTMQ